VGLICAAVGLYGVIDSAWFRIRGELVDATVVGVDQRGEAPVDILAFTVSGRQRHARPRGSFGMVWERGRPLGSRVRVVYAPDNPEHARLAAVAPQFCIPVILLVLGLIFTYAGRLVLTGDRRLHRRRRRA
jgi:hypothetical protein